MTLVDLASTLDSQWTAPKVTRLLTWTFRTRASMTSFGSGSTASSTRVPLSRRTILTSLGTGTSRFTATLSTTLRALSVYSPRTRDSFRAVLERPAGGGFLGDVVANGPCSKVTIEGATTYCLMNPQQDRQVFKFCKQDLLDGGPKPTRPGSIRGAVNPL